MRRVLPALPLTFWLLWFLAIPLVFVAIYSVYERGPYGNVVPAFTAANYLRAADGLYIGIFVRSLGLATLTTLACLVIGYPLAYALATAPPALRPPLFALLMVPFLTNFVVRVYAIRLILGPEGPFGLDLNDTLGAVAIGLITNYLPFMVLPLYVVIDRFDFTLLEAAQDLGGHGWRAVLRVLLPLTKAGIISGSVLTFVPALGEFMIPDLLGGARTMLLGNLITEQFLKARDWPFGAALCMLLVVVMALGFALQAWGTRASHESAL